MTTDTNASLRRVVADDPGLYFVAVFLVSAWSSSLTGGVGRDAEHIAKSARVATSDRVDDDMPR